ncbi:MAG: glycosyl hydrolase [Phycisphaerae bacterium]
MIQFGILLALLSPSETRPATRPDEPRTHNLLSPEEQAAGFRLLFNGRDLADWEHNGKPGSFTVRDGVLTGDRTGHSDWAYWLSTRREYADFELRLQYKLSKGGNSGVFIRAPRQGRASRLGMEVQLLDDGHKRGKPGPGDTGAIYQVAAASSFVSKPAGQWNDLWILCEGDHVRVTLNGQVINDLSMADHEKLRARPRKGYIGLSAHTDPVQFRDIRIREISSGREGRPPATRPE